MSEPFDEYIDQFLSTVGAYGISIIFQRSAPLQGSPGSVSPAEDVGVIRMSLEHLKTMAFVLKQQVDNAEMELGVTIPVSHRVLNALKVAPEDWDKFLSKD